MYNYFTFDFQEAGPAEPQPAQDTGQSPEDQLAEARISFEFGDMKGAQARLDSLLKIDPGNVEAQELLNQIRGASSTGIVLEPTSSAPIELTEDSQPSLGDSQPSLGDSQPSTV